MANSDFAAIENLSHEEKTKRFPMNGDPFAVWYDAEGVQEGSATPWIVNGPSGDSLADLENYAAAKRISSLLQGRFIESNDNLSKAIRSLDFVIEAATLQKEIHMSPEATTGFSFILQDIRDVIEGAMKEAYHI